MFNRNLALTVILGLGVTLTYVWLDTSSQQEEAKPSVVKEEKAPEQIEETFPVEEPVTTLVETKELPKPAAPKEPVILLNFFENEKLQIALTYRNDVSPFTDTNTTQSVYIKITQNENVVDIHRLDLNTTFILSADQLDFMVKEKQKNLTTFGSAYPLTQMESNQSYIVHLSIDTDPICVEIIERPKYKALKHISFDKNATRLDPKKAYYINGYRLNIVERNVTADSKAAVLKTLQKDTP